MANVIYSRRLFGSLGRFPHGHQQQIRRCIHRFKENPALPSLGLEKVSRARSADVWSVRASDDLRVILHKDGDTWAIHYAGHHDDAYEWARRRDIGRHTITGAYQVVETIETLRMVERPAQTQHSDPAVTRFGAHDDDYLISLGVPESWLPALRKVSDDDQVLMLCEQLPGDVANRLMDLATGKAVTPPPPARPDQPLSAYSRMDFYVPSDEQELEAALAAPMEHWMIFLHPSQLEVVERRFNGPAKVSGSAGTGKTVVALHRARHLARQGERVLLTGFVKTLTQYIEQKLGLLCSEAELRLITVDTVHKQALKIIQQADPAVKVADEQLLRMLLDKHRRANAPGWDEDFVCAEWDHVIRAQGIGTWKGYRDARRDGRARPLYDGDREVLWKVFAGVLAELDRRKLLDFMGMPQRACELLRRGKARSPYTAVIADEVQDLRAPELQFLHALALPENLMLCGDAGQRVFPGRFTLSSLGIDVRGRSTILRINYRTSERIRRFAAPLRGPVDDMDGGTETGDEPRSLYRGSVPLLMGHPDRDAEAAAAVRQIRAWLAQGIQGEAIGVFARTRPLTEPLCEALTAQGIPWRRLTENRPPDAREVRIDTMQRAKGLEFQAVLVMGCSSLSLPDASARRSSDDPEDRKAALAREKQLLYVAVTRARNELAVSWSGEPSPFIVECLNGAADGKDQDG